MFPNEDRLWNDANPRTPKAMPSSARSNNVPIDQTDDILELYEQLHIFRDSYTIYLLDEIQLKVEKAVSNKSNYHIKAFI